MSGTSRGGRRAPYIALGVVGALVAGSLIAALWPRPQYDPRNLCPLDGVYPRTAVLIDATDVLSDSQVKTITEEIDALRRRLAVHEWVGIFVLNECDLALPTPEVALCNPGDESAANVLYENPRQMQRRFEREFQAPIEAAVRRLSQLPSSSTSPLLEMIQAVAGDRNFDSTASRRLIIVSDMLQNVPAYSHYRDGADFATWRNTNYAREFLQLSLLGVEVDILYLKRIADGTREKQTRGHVAFWEDYFDAVGATVNTLKPIL